jgi:2-dehydro-3-deoxygalactonokinase
LSHALFGVRARVVAKMAPAAHAASYLSGLLIGVEWADVQRRNGGRLPEQVTALGTPALALRHADAARCLGAQLSALDVREAHVAALNAMRMAL